MNRHNIFLLCILLGVVGAVSYLMGGKSPIDHPSDWVNAVSTVAIVAAFMFSVWQYRRREVIADEEVHLNQANLAIERACELLTPEAKGNPPPDDRFRWLTAARLLLAAEALGRRLTGSRRTVFLATRAYYRARMIELCAPLMIAPSTYWAHDAKHMLVYSQTDKEPISEKSARVVYKWVYTNDDLDPLRDQPRFTVSEIENMQMFDWHGLGDLLEEVNEILDKAKNQSDTHPN